MVIEIKEIPQPKVFTPVKLIITLEQEEEVHALITMMKYTVTECGTLNRVGSTANNILRELIKLV